jgi:hypothetical protein
MEILDAEHLQLTLIISKVNQPLLYGFCRFLVHHIVGTTWSAEVHIFEGRQLCQNCTQIVIARLEILHGGYRNNYGCETHKHTQFELFV